MSNTIKGSEIKLPKTVTITIHKSCISYKTDGNRKAYLKGSTLELSHIDPNCQKEVKKCKQGNIIGKVKITSTSDLESFLNGYFKTATKSVTKTAKAPTPPVPESVAA